MCEKFFVRSENLYRGVSVVKKLIFAFTRGTLKIVILTVPLLLLSFRYVSAVESLEGNKGESLQQGLRSLKKLSVFKDVVVLQKRYFPKTHRFSLSLKGGGVVNDAYFISSKLGSELSFYFTERWGLFVDYAVFSNSKKQHTDRLLNDRGVLTSFVAPKSLQSAGLRWTPMYGKVAFLQRKIVYFDHYFSLGYGNIRLDTGASTPLISLGTGQIFPLNKSVAFHWDITLKHYTTQEIVQSRKNTSIKKLERIEETFYTLVFNLGFNFFYPGADSR